MPSVLPLSRDGGMCHEESAEPILARVTKGEGPSFVLRTRAFVVRVTVDIGGRAEMCGNRAVGTGRNPGEDRKSVSRHPLTRGTPAPEQEQLMKCVVERSNMQAALKRVRKNKGAPGIDGINVEQLGTFLRRHWSKIKERLCGGTYEPKLVRRVQIPKSNGGIRPLGIPTVLDRLIQQALHQVLSPLFDPGFSEHSYGFRSGRNAHQAVLSNIVLNDLDKELESRGRNIVRFIQKDLNSVLRGWSNSFRITEFRGFAEELDQWLRRRLRCILWQQWKRPWMRFQMLMKHGLSEERAARSAFNQKGPWFNAGASHMNQAFPKRYFDQFGLISTLKTLQRFGTVLT